MVKECVPVLFIAVGVLRHVDGRLSPNTISIFIPPSSGHVFFVILPLLVAFSAVSMEFRNEWDFHEIN